MWDREYVKATWNGVEFNIINTANDSGTRLHVEEMPYEDLSFIEVMGSITPSYKFTAVFVGVNSLSDANQFKRSLAADPVGYLEHPYLGELNLIYKGSSTSFSSMKKGIVTLTLQFIDQGSEIDIHDIIESLATIETGTLNESAEVFVIQIEKSNHIEISNIQSEFTEALTTLRKIANQLQTPSNILSSFHRQITDGISAVSSIVNSPAAFIGQIQLIFKSMQNESKSLTINKPVYNDKNRQVKLLTLIDRRVLATKSLSTISTNNISLGILIVMSKIQLSTNLEDLKEDKVETNLKTIELEVRSLIDEVEDLIVLISASSDHQTINLFEHLHKIKHYLLLQHQNIKARLSNSVLIIAVEPTPTLLIAHQNETNDFQLNLLNKFSHPLFAQGEILVPNE